MGYLLWMKHAFEYFGGSRDDPPPGMLPAPGSPLWGLWWGLLSALILLFSGQSSKFIYIDF
jgi:hypothetical protein